MILVDTSVLIGFFRGDTSPAIERLAGLDERSELFSIPAVCVQEVLQGARGEQEWRNLVEVLETQQVLHPIDGWATHILAARIYYDCRRRGVTIRSTIDCCIAAQALETESTLLHNDADFERMKKVCPLKTLH